MAELTYVGLAENAVQNFPPITSIQCVVFCVNINGLLLHYVIVSGTAALILKFFLIQLLAS